MALIKCPECGREISDRAAVCPVCAYPIMENSADGDVQIKLPNSVVADKGNFLAKRECCIGSRTTKEILWQGKPVEYVKFHITTAHDIVIDLGGRANLIECRVEPNRKYSLLKDKGIHMLTTFKLTEVDFAGSD